MQDPYQPVALEVTLVADRGVVGDDPLLECGIADRYPPRERQRRRLNRGRHRVVVMDHVVKQPPRASDRMLPEDRVTDEAVGPRRGEQRLELGPGARRVKVPPRDRGEEIYAWIKGKPLLRRSRQAAVYRSGYDPTNWLRSGTIRYFQPLSPTAEFVSLPFWMRKKRGDPRILAFPNFA